MAKGKSQTPKKKLRSHFSAGGAVYRRKVERVEKVEKVEWLLIKPAGTSRWQLPKGTIESGEKSDITTEREVFEETGIKAKVLEKINTTRYFFVLKQEKIFKSVVFFLMKSDGGEPKVESEWAHEVEDARWFEFDDALEKLTYKSEREILKKAQKMLEKY